MKNSGGWKKACSSSGYGSLTFVLTAFVLSVYVLTIFVLAIFILATLFKKMLSNICFWDLYFCYIYSNVICFISLCGLYYKPMTIVNDNSSIVSRWSFKLIDDPRVVIYDRHMFIVQATGQMTFSSLCLKREILKGEVSLNRWSPVSLVWISLFGK